MAIQLRELRARKKKKQRNKERKIKKKEAISVPKCKSVHARNSWSHWKSSPWIRWCWNDCRSENPGGSSIQFKQPSIRGFVQVSERTRTRSRSLKLSETGSRLCRFRERARNPLRFGTGLRTGESRAGGGEKSGYLNRESVCNLLQHAASLTFSSFSRFFTLERGYDLTNFPSRSGLISFNYPCVNDP